MGRGPMHLTQTQIEKSEPKETAYDLRDDAPIGLLLRVQPTGLKTWYVDSNKLPGRHKLAPLTVMRLSQARAAAIALLRDGPPKPSTPAAKLLRAFLSDDYGPWALAHQKDAKASLARILAACGPLLDIPLNALTTKIIVDWRTGRLQTVQRTTANRDYTALRSALSRALEWEMIEQHPMARLKPLPATTGRPGRAATIEEETALRTAVIAEDFLRPMIVISLGTGLRQGELFQLRWLDVDAGRGAITLRPETTKTGMGRIVPMNRTVRKAIQEWHEIAPDQPLVFPSRVNGVRDNIAKPWRKLLAQCRIEDLHMHDLRHTFITRMAERGVSEGIIAVIVGHSRSSMTSRYTHLGFDTLLEAVQLLDAKP